MTETLRRLRLNPRTAVAAVLALAALVWWRSRGGGGGGPFTENSDGSLAPLAGGTVATGDFSSLPVEPDPAPTGPVTIPFPTTGGVIIPEPGADPIVFQPPGSTPTGPITVPLPPSGGVILPGPGQDFDPIIIQPTPATPTPTPTPTPKRLFYYNRYWSPGQIDAFHREWTRRRRAHKPKPLPTTVAAWRAWLAVHPGVKRFFFPPAPATSSSSASTSSASSAAAVPRTQQAAGSATAAGAAI